MGIVTLGVIWLMHGTALALSNAEEKVAVLDMDHQIPEFLFNCLQKKDPWINPCSVFRRYLMIFDSRGNYFQETINPLDNNTHLTTSFMKTARKPMGKQIIEGHGYPKYLLQLERAGGAGLDSFYIATKSGQLLVAGSEISPSLHLREDFCSLGKHEQFNSNNLSNSSLSTTQPPVTAVSIVDYGCDQAKWRLWKVDKRFLLIESVSKPGFFLNVDEATHYVQLGMPEKMTGIRTSFLSHITLERNDVKPEDGIGANAYGDVMVHYVERDGSHQSGYICEHEWGEESASSICKNRGFETGIPTYNGQYSDTSTPEYVVSGFKCLDENLDDCTFRTVCGRTQSCIAQNSVKQFGGKGYACNRGSSTDIAGVVCGTQTQINNVLKKEEPCNRSTLATDRTSVAGMFKIQKQMKTVSSTMFENKHWSEYLLPMPMAVSLMSALLLVSSQNDIEIELVKPDQGHWDHLKYNYLQPNLLLLSHNVKENFLLSNANMGVIKVNTKTIHRNMKQALQNAFSTSKYDYKTLLPRNLKHIAEDAKTNKEKAEEVYIAFTTTNQIIDELLQGLKNTQGFQQNGKAESVKALKVLENEQESDRLELEEEKKKLKEYEAQVKESRNAFFEAAKDAMNAQCVEDVLECNNCALEVPLRTDRCKPGKTKTVCREWSDPICLKEENVCTGGWTDKTCKHWRKKCVSRFFGCHRYVDVCDGWENPKCKKYEILCMQNSPEAKCKREEILCLDYEYSPAVRGVYCQDSDKRQKLCTRCKWIDDVSKNMENVADITLKMQHSVLNGESSYAAVLGVIEELVTHVKVIDQDIQNYKKWKTTSKIVPSPQAVNNGSQLMNASRTMNNVSQAVIESLSNRMSAGIREMYNASQPNNLELEAKRDIGSTLRLTKLSIDMIIDLLSREKLPIAKKSSKFAMEFKGLIEYLLTRKVNKVGEMTEKEKISITTLFTQGKVLLQEGTQLKAKHEISIPEDGGPGGAADHKTGGLAANHLDYLSKRHKTQKVIESLSNRMSAGIRAMFKEEVEKADINSIITKLIDCSRYLNFLSEQWIELRIFFKKLSDFLEIMQKRIKRMSEFYLDMGVNIERSKLTKAFKENLQREIVDALANNIYVGRIASYYTKIAEDGLLQRMASIGNYLGQVKNEQVFEQLKQYIEDESIMTQNRIKAEVSNEEAKINDAIMKDVYSIKNDLACKLEDAENVPEETLIALNSIAKAQNSLDNVVTKIASPDAVDDMNLFDDVTVDLADNVEAITNNVAMFDDEDMDNWF